MKIKFLKIGLPIILGIGTITTATMTLSSCSKTNSLDNINPTPLRSLNYKDYFPNLTVEEFKAKLNTKEGKEFVLNTLQLGANLYKYVDKSLKIQGSIASFWISTIKETKKIYEIKLYNFFDKNNDPNPEFNIAKNKIIPSNIKNNQYFSISNFQFNNFENVNLSNLKTLNNQDILIDKKNALNSTEVKERIANYNSNLLMNFLNDIDGGIKLILVQAFNSANLLMSSDNLFYFRDIKQNPDTKKLEGNIYIQIKNNTNQPLNMNLFNKTHEIPVNQYLTVGLNLNSNIKADIFEISNKNFLGFNLDNVNISYEISNNNVESQTSSLEIKKSNTLKTEVSGVSLNNQLFNEKTTFSNEIAKLDTQFFLDSLTKNANDEFLKLKNAIVNGIAILEKFANVDVTLEQVLTSIGDNVAAILKMVKVNDDITNIVKNLLSPQSTSDFLFNSFNSIIKILDQNGANIVASPAYFIKNFLIDNLGSKDKQGFEYFIKNLKNLKETIKKFLIAIPTLEPSAISSIMLLVDYVSENNNIFNVLAKNKDIILNLIKSFIPNTPSDGTKIDISKIVLNVVNAISQIEVDNHKGNILTDKFWNLVTNTNTNVKTLLTNLLVTISDLLPNSDKPQGNLIKEALIWIKNFIDATSMVQNFTPNNLVETLQTLLNMKPDGSPLVEGGLTTKQYFENCFVIDIPQQQTLNFDNVNQVLNGEFQYTFKFTQELKWDMTKFKSVFYDDGLKLFSYYASWWYEQTKPTTNSDKNFIFAINTLSEIIGKALAPNKSSVESIPTWPSFMIPQNVKNLRKILLEFIDINTLELTEQQKTDRNKANFKLLFETDFSTLPKSLLSLIEAFLPINLPIKDLVQLSMTINNQDAINKTYERYWKFIFGDNQTSANPSYNIPANSSFTTTDSYQNSHVYPNVEQDGSITWRAPSLWRRDLKGMDGVFKQSALSRVLFAFTNQSKSVNFINNDVVKTAISQTNISNYSDNVANLDYKLILNTKDIELTNELFNTLKTSYNNSVITPEIQEALNKVFVMHYGNDFNIGLFKPTFFIIPNDPKNPTKYNIQIFFPTNLIIVDKENENLTNKIVDFRNSYSFDLVHITA